MPDDHAGLPVLGWKERASLPQWHISRLRVKLDTGARTSAIHVSAMETVGEHEQGGDTLPVLELTVPLSRVRTDRVARVVAPVTGYKSVRDTGGEAEHRPVVRTRVVIGPLDREIDVTITDRSGMLYRMILGRQALAGHALVDPQQVYRASPPTPPPPDGHGGTDGAATNPRDAAIGKDR